MYIDFISTLILENLKLFLKLLSSGKKKKKGVQSPKPSLAHSILTSSINTVTVGLPGLPRLSGIYSAHAQRLMGRILNEFAEVIQPNFEG